MAGNGAMNPKLVDEGISDDFYCSTAIENDLVACTWQTNIPRVNKAAQKPAIQNYNMTTI